jgi:broad specificity phosphatase PhoE
MFFSTVLLLFVLSMTTAAPTKDQKPGNVVPSSTKTIIFIRHGEALHNVKPDMDEYDPPLTDKGINQCKTLAERLEKLDLIGKVQVIFSSPLQRTLQTTTHGLSSTIKKKIPVYPHPLFQEDSTKRADTGMAIQNTKKAFPSFNYQFLAAPYPTKSGIYAFTEEALNQRAKAAWKFLGERPESVIVVVSHNWFLRAMVQRHFANADYRTFVYDPSGQKKLEELSQDSGGSGKVDSEIFPEIRSWEAELMKDEVLLQAAGFKDGLATKGLPGVMYPIPPGAKAANEGQGIHGAALVKAMTALPKSTKA